MINKECTCHLMGTFIVRCATADDDDVCYDDDDVDASAVFERYHTKYVFIINCSVFHFHERLTRATSL